MRQDIQEICRASFANMPKEAQELAAKQYGSAENYQEYLLEQMSTERARKTMAKLVEWYGGK